MDNFSLALLLLISGTVFFFGFCLGSTFFAWVLRRREARITRKVQALEYLRRNEHINPSLVVDYLIDQERRERATRRTRRWSR